MFTDEQRRAIVAKYGVISSEDEREISKLFNQMSSNGNKVCLEDIASSYLNRKTGEAMEAVWNKPIDLNHLTSHPYGVQDSVTSKHPFSRFSEYQSLASSTAIYPGKGNNLYYPALGLAGEAGEICNKVKKIMRDNDGKLTDETRAILKAELGDVLWYLAALATELGVDLHDIAQENIDKLFSRKERGTLKGDGDNR